MYPKETGPLQDKIKQSQRSYNETTSAFETVFTTLNAIKQCESIQQHINDLRVVLDQKLSHTGSTSLGNGPSNVEKELHVSYKILDTLEKLNGFWIQKYTDKETEIQNLHKV